MTVQSRTELVPALRDVRAVVLYTDRLITESARVHAAAWRAAFDAFLRAHPPEDRGAGRRFDVRDDSLRYVDGRSRLDGSATGTGWSALRDLRDPTYSPGLGQ